MNPCNRCERRLRYDQLDDVRWAHDRHRIQWSPSAWLQAVSIFPSVQDWASRLMSAMGRSWPKRVESGHWPRCAICARTGFAKFSRCSQCRRAGFRPRNRRSRPGRGPITYSLVGNEISSGSARSSWWWDLLPSCVTNAIARSFCGSAQRGHGAGK